MRRIHTMLLGAVAVLACAAFAADQAAKSLCRSKPPPRSS